MADRSIVIKLKAEIGDFKKGMGEAAKSTKEAKEELGDATTKAQALGRAAVEHSTAFIAVGVALEEFARRGIMKFAEFDEAMSGVAATGDDARQNIEALTEAALKFGADTAYNATECAEAISELAKAGLGAADILGGALAGSLDLAASEGMAVAEAAAITATALQQFHLEGSKAVYVADLLAAGAGKAMGSAHDLGEGLKNAGMMAAQMGMGIDETIGTLAAFAQYGLIGAEAGTAMKSMLLQLVDPSNKAAGMMEELGIHTHDANGHFIGMTALAGELQTKLAGLTDQQRDQAMATIFGAYAIRAANVLYNEGAEGIANWIRECNDWGYAAQAAAAKTDNLSGDLERLGGTFETMAIQSGSGLNGSLRGLVQLADDLLGKFGSLPTPVLSTGLALTGLAGIALVGIGTFGKFVKILNEVREAEILTEATTGKLGKGLGALGGVAAAVAIAIAALQLEGSLMDGLNRTGKDLPDVGHMVNGMQNYVQQLGQASTEADKAAVRSRTLNELFSIQVGKMDGATVSMHDFAYQMNQVNHGFWGLLDSATAWFSTSPNEVFTTHLGNVNQALSELVNRGYADEANALLNEIKDTFKSEGWSDQEISSAFAQTELAIETTTLASERLAATLKMHSAAPLIEETSRAEKIIASLGDKADKVSEELFAFGLSTEQAAALVLRFGENASKGFQAFADHYANAAASISNGQNAWDNARGKMEKPPSMKAWIKALEEQAKAFEEYKENLEGVSQRIKDELPADAQYTAEAMINAYANNPQAIAMLMKSTQAELAATVDAWGRTGEGAGAAWAQGFAIQVLAGAGIFDNVIESIDGRKVTVTVDGDARPLEEIAHGAILQIDQSNGTVTIKGQDGELLSTLTNAVYSVNESTGTVTIKGNDALGREVLYQFKGSIDQTTGKVIISADARLGYEVLDAFKKAATQGVTVPIFGNVINNTLGTVAGIVAKNKAVGGPIFGGQPGVDSVPIMAMPGEHVLTTAEVTALGGHAGVFALRAAALAGELQAFANGGPVLSRASTAPVFLPATQHNSATGRGAQIQIDPRQLASALTGMSFTLNVDGQPIRAIAQAAVMGPLNSTITGMKRGGSFA